jgi:D-inositol-3-phosphate glycosyltransferase
MWGTGQRIIHLLDDDTPGGVTRLLDHIAADPVLAQMGEHRVQPVRRGAIGRSLREADVIVSHLTPGWRSLPGLMTLRALNPDRTLIHVEHSYSAGFLAAGVLHRARFMTMLRTAYSLFDRVVAVSDEQAAFLRRHGLARPGTLAVVPPAVDLGPFLGLAPRGGPARIFGGIGRLVPQKGFDILIAAFRGLEDPALRLRIVGNGPERAALCAAASGDPRISIESFAAQPSRVMADLDAVAMPSRWEPFGLVGLEARAAGRLLLAASVDGLKDQAAEGGVAVRGQGVEVWREALAAAAEGRPGHDAAAARAAARRVSDRFRQGWAEVLGGRQPRPDHAAA